MSEPIYSCCSNSPKFLIHYKYGNNYKVCSRCFSLREFSEGIENNGGYQIMKLSQSGNWETPDFLFASLIKQYGIAPELDVACNIANCKCLEGLHDALEEDWISTTGKRVDVWCNPPHSMNRAFVGKAYEQWKKHNINIMMILPANAVSTIYWHKYIEGIAEYHPIKNRIRFLIDGRPSEYPSRNAYLVVIFRKKEVLN